MLVTRGKRYSAPNRFAQPVAAPSVAGTLQPRPNLETIRNLERAGVQRFNQNGVWLPNPSADAPFDRHAPQGYQSKVLGLGIGPNLPRHFWQLIKGDSGAGSSIYRTAELYQLLGPAGQRTAATPYSKAIQIATMKATDQRPRYFHTSLFSVGRITRVEGAGAPPLPTSEISRFAPGIPTGTPSTTGNTQFEIPQFSTTKFRIMVFDESGQRFVDVDVLGTRSMNLYGFGVTVFALIKEEGYEIDRQRDDNRPLGPGIVDQGIVGARIVPIRSNDTKSINNRTVTIISPTGPAEPTIVPIPPGAKRVQGYTSPPGADTQSIFFATVDPLNPGTAIDTSQGSIDFPPTPEARTALYDIPNANAIVIINGGGDPGREWVFVFEVTS